MLYFAQVIAYTGILYMVYILLLRNRPMHNFNRAYLLSIVVLPVIIPLVKLSALASFFENNRVVNVRLPEMVVSGTQQQQSVNNAIDWMMMAYLAIGLTMIILFLRKWMKLRTVIKRGIRIEEDEYVLLLNTSHGPGSWGKYILLPDEQIHETIVEHEAAHIRLKHSRDIVLINVMQCAFWPNLFLHAIKKELKQLHEFQADAAVGMNRLQYGELLLANVFNTCTLPLTHSFNIHPVKRRIMMLKKRISKPIALTVGLVAVLATGTLLFNMVALQSCKHKKWEVFKAEQVDKMAEFNGDYAKFMSENIVYPQEAINKGIEGRVLVKFIVNEEGQPVYRDIIKSPDTLLSIAAIDVLKKMPWWKPAEKNGKKVAVEFVMPISFKLPTDSASVSGEIEKVKSEYEKKQDEMQIKYQKEIEDEIERVKNNPKTIKTSSSDVNIAKQVLSKLGNRSINDFKTEQEKSGFKARMDRNIQPKSNVQSDAKTDKADRKHVTWKMKDDGIKNAENKKAYAQAVMDKIVKILDNDGAIPIKEELSMGELDEILAKLEQKKNSKQ